MTTVSGELVKVWTQWPDSIEVISHWEETNIPNLGNWSDYSAKP